MQDWNQTQATFSIRTLRSPMRSRYLAESEIILSVRSSPTGAEWTFVAVFQKSEWILEVERRQNRFENISSFSPLRKNNRFHCCPGRPISGLNTSRAMNREVLKKSSPSPGGLRVLICETLTIRKRRTKRAWQTKKAVERSFALFCQKEVSSTETRLHASWVQLEPFQGLATTGAILEDGPS